MPGYVEPYILKNGVKRWRFRFYDGKHNNYKKSGFKKKSDAEDALNSFVSAFKTNKGIYNSKYKVSELQNMYYKNKVLDKKAPSTQDRYDLFRRQINEEIGSMKMVDLTPMSIELFYNETAKKKKWSINTTIKLHRYFRMTMDYAVRNHIISSNPADLVELEKYQKAKITVWDATKVYEYLDMLKESLIYQVIALGAMTGLRLSELLALEWSDIDLKNGYLTVTKTVYRRNGQTLIKPTPKTKTSNRVIPLLPGTIEFLKTIPVRIGAPVLNYNGQYWNPKNVSKYFAYDIKKYGVPVIRFHDLRHTYATLLLKAGSNDLIISQTLGHSSVAFTKDIYSHPDVAFQRKELSKASKFLEKGQKKDRKKLK